MIICPECKRTTADEALMCEKCGSPLPAAVEADETMVIHDAELRTMPTPQRQWRSAEVGSNLVIELHIDSRICPVNLTPDGITIIGRSDDDIGAGPDIDLATFGGFDMGVSRMHAALLLDNGVLKVRDLSSTNGTYVNGQGVSNEEWRMVRDRDELRLGKLMTKVHFRNLN